MDGLISIVIFLSCVIGAFLIILYWMAERIKYLNGQIKMWEGLHREEIEEYRKWLQTYQRESIINRTKIARMEALLKNSVVRDPKTGRYVKRETDLDKLKEVYK